MNEAQTRFNKIDPKLRDAGWGIVPGSNIQVEQSANIALGRLTASGNKNFKKADYIFKSKVDRLQANYDKILQECDALTQAILREVFE